MKVPLLTRQQLEIINRRMLRYPLQIAEKDYFLAIVMQIIAESKWGERLVFKGGTAVHHCYLEQYRFSEDLDFSSNGVNISIEDVGNLFVDFPFLTIKKYRLSDATVKVEKLQYSGPLTQPNSLKMEIDILQNVLLPPQVLKYRNVWGLDFTVTIMDVREVCAEKIRAMSDRARYRDFYDLFLLIEKYNPSLDEIVSYVAKKEIRQPIAKDNIRNNWMILGTQKAQEIGQIYYLREVADEQIRDLIENLPFTEIA